MNPDRTLRRLRPGGRAQPRRTSGRRHLQVFGQKIFITYGEHDMTDNIVHLVLAGPPTRRKASRASPSSSFPSSCSRPTAPW